MTRCIVALDQGTTSSRTLVFDRSGRILGQAQREHAQHFPQSGWVEHDAEEIWRAQSDTLAAALRAAGVTPRDVAAIGVANQRETTLLWERASGRPLARAIVWQDRRTAPLCEALAAAGHQPEITRRTGLLLDPYFSGTKLAWLLDHLPRARERAARGELAFGTIDSWLAWKLSGGTEHITDVTNASRTLLFNIHSGDWDDALLSLLRIPRACLPRILPSSGALAQALLDGERVPVAGIAGDQQAALFGQACFHPGMAKNTYGTGCFLLMATGTHARCSQHGLLTTGAWQLAGQPLHYALEGSVFTGGAVVQWLRDSLGFIRSAAEVEALAAGVADSGGVYLVPAFTGLGAPYWDPHARGLITGLSRGTGPAHIARAGLEAIAFQSTVLLQAMQADAGQPLRELRVDGGASRNDLLMQFQADLLQVLVIRPRITETTALGAACLAGLAAGFWSSQEELSANWQVERTFEPHMGADEAATRLEQWARAVDRARLSAG